MVKSELLHALSKQLPVLQEQDVNAGLNCILEQLTAALVQGERIEIRGFSSFHVRHQPSRIARNPKTGEAVHLQTQHVVRFKPGKEMRERVNASRNQ